MTTREALWTEQDRAEVLALALYRSWLCPCGCGHLAEDSLSHEDGGPKFVASRVVCRAKLAIVEQQRALDSSNTPSRDAAARLWTTEKR